MGLTRRNAEKLVLLADDEGYICYGDIHRALPWVDDHVMYHLIADGFVNPMGLDVNLLDEHTLLIWDQRPADYGPGYVFKPSDRFRLTIEGEDIKYAAEKDRHQEFIALATLIISALSFLAAMLPLFLLFIKVVTAGAWS
ncbi:hypothetical protein [uncultured Dialister sp.]|uniref:hypothetical protein n=1 Tax=uncultured Dialister sp. TaxID=278064 RepID=UPI0026DB9BF8|nr:hypothetical protein [uncultured Dialister sp.]